MILHLSLDLPEDGAYLHLTRAVGQAVLESLRVQTAIIGDVEIVLSELYSNVLRHARSEEGRFSITLDYYAERLVVTVEDKGQGFSFKDVPPSGRSARTWTAVSVTAASGCNWWPRCRTSWSSTATTTRG